MKNKLSKKLISLGALYVACAGLPLSSSAFARDLDARQKQVLADAAGHQTKFETNLKLALDSAGPGDATPPASKARLAMTRLNSAMQSVPTLEARFAELPADDEAVKQLKAKFDAAMADAKKLEARLTAKPAPQAPAADAPAQQPVKQQPAAAPAGGAAKLDYRQEEALKGAKFNLNQVDGYANAIDELVTTLNATTDKSAVDFRQVVRGINSIEEGRRKLKFASDGLANLPANGRGVAEASEQLASLTKRLDAAEATLKPLNEKLQGAINPDNYPDLRADRTRLSELAQMFRVDLIQADKPAAVEVIKTADAARQERNRITEKYAELLKQDTPVGKEVAGSAAHFDERYKQFAQAMGDWMKVAPNEIEADLKKVSEMSATAVAEQKPAWFGGGIPQHVAFAQEKIDLYAAMDDSAAKPFVEKLAALKADLKTQEAKLSEGIIAANVVPPDRYRGGDRAELEALATANWKEVEPNAEVLKICIPGEQWNRETMWRWSNSSFYKIDRSKLQAQLIVVKDDKIAAIRPVNLWIDHLSSDKKTATNLDDIKDELPPSRLMLRANVK